MCAAPTKASFIIERVHFSLFVVADNSSRRTDNESLRTKRCGVNRLMATALLMLMFPKQIIDAVKGMLSGALFILIVMAFRKSEKFLWHFELESIWKFSNSIKAPLNDMVRSAARAEIGDVAAGRLSMYEIIGLAYKWETFSFHLLRLE